MSVCVGVGVVLPAPAICKCKAGFGPVLELPSSELVGDTLVSDSFAENSVFTDVLGLGSGLP